MDPTGDNKVSHPELEVTVELLEHETWEQRSANEIQKKDEKKKMWMDDEHNPVEVEHLRVNGAEF